MTIFRFERTHSIQIEHLSNLPIQSYGGRIIDIFVTLPEYLNLLSLALLIPRSKRCSKGGAGIRICRGEFNGLSEFRGA